MELDPTEDELHQSQLSAKQWKCQGRKSQFLSLMYFLPLFVVEVDELICLEKKSTMIGNIKIFFY